MNKLTPQKGGFLTGRELEWFHHSALPQWGYEKDQTDTFAVMHPADEIPDRQYPLYVVFHSAGHDVYSAVACTWLPGNHDIYHPPKDMYALFLDCRQHEDVDWWWGGNSALEVLGKDRAGVKKQPVEHRCIDTVTWVLENFPIARNRVYAVGNSMGGSGALGVAMCRGDIFAAVKVNVPAGVRHIADRMALDTPAPEDFRLPDPPILVDYSAQDDDWSTGHQILYRGMREKKYPLMGFWGKFGHANNHELIRETNDLIHAFDPFSVRLDEAYPVFTNADSDDLIPWAEDGSIISDNAGQVNGYFRWNTPVETKDSVSVSLRLITAKDWNSRITFPENASADVTLRRLQKCRFAPGAKVTWTFGAQNGSVTADKDGLVTVPALQITAEPKDLILKIG